MDSSEFWSGLKEYWSLWNSGLKKEANRRLDQTMRQIDTWELKRKRTVLLEFCADVCENENSPYRSMHSGLPYGLFTPVKAVLYDCCADMGMPYLRWCYELCGKDVEILKKAYDHPDCDEKAAELYFQVFLYDLFMGAHHFPHYSLMSEEVFLETVKSCEEIKNRHELPKPLIQEYEEYVKLYTIWWEREKSGDPRAFAEICRAEGYEFSPIEAYYYSK